MSASKNGAGIKRLCWLDVARTEAIAISHRISDVFQVFGVFARTTKRILPSFLPLGNSALSCPSSARRRSLSYIFARLLHCIVSGEMRLQPNRRSRSRSRSRRSDASPILIDFAGKQKKVGNREGEGSAPLPRLGLTVQYILHFATKYEIAKDFLRETS